MRPLVSVVMPCHNAERWIGAAMQSVLTQTCDRIELIVVDDGSSDSSRRLIERTACVDRRVRLLALPDNKGVVHALNVGLDSANGAYIARMDADDICMPDRLAQQLAFLEETGLDLCGTWFVEFGQGIPRIVRWPDAESAVRAAMLFQNALCHPTVMARSSVFERLRYREDYRLVEDYDLFARACGEFRIANLPKPLLRYRRHLQQATQAKRDAMEVVTRRIRLEALQRQGYEATAEEQRLHNLIRAPYSIQDPDDLHGIEAWLLKLRALHGKTEARRVIASQWIRACIRAAPLGMAMWRTFCASPLRKASGASAFTTMDLGVLAAMKLDYRSRTFAVLRRLGLSA